jgi:MoaA/NifB/PqqE/SkfB family radical SAM enzyme
MSAMINDDERSASLELNKSILLANSKGEGRAYSPEELMTLRINRWKGWSCAAGFDHIQVSPDGNVKAAACAVKSEYIGNIYEGDLTFPKKWLKCTIEYCMCGTDMRLRKTKDESLRGEIESRVAKKDLPLELKTPAAAEWVGSAQWGKFLSHPKSVSWDISKRCNFQCSYCHPTISNQTDRLRTREELFNAVFRIMRGFARGQRINWIIAGGEPTLHSCYMELCELLQKKQHIVHTQTNGSRLPAYYGELIRWSNIGISVHLEFADPAKIVEVARAVVEQKERELQSSRNWFGVRIMVGPGKFARALELSQALEKMPLFAKHGLVFMSTLYEREERDQLMQYDPVEFQEILARS